MPEGLQLSFTKAALKHFPETKKANNIGLQRLHEAKRRKEEVLKQAGIERAREEYIRCLGYHLMWKSARCWKTAEEVDNGLANTWLLKDQRDALKDNIQFDTWEWDGTIAIQHGPRMERISQLKC